MAKWTILLLLVAITGGCVSLMTPDNGHFVPGATATLQNDASERLLGSSCGG